MGALIRVVLAKRRIVLTLEWALVRRARRTRRMGTLIRVVLAISRVTAFGWALWAFAIFGRTLVRVAQTIGRILTLLWALARRTKLAFPFCVLNTIFICQAFRWTGRGNSACTHPGAFENIRTFGELATF